MEKTRAAGVGLDCVRTVLMKDANFDYLKIFLWEIVISSIIKNDILHVVDSRQEAVADHVFLEREKIIL